MKASISLIRQSFAAQKSRRALYTISYIVIRTYTWTAASPSPRDKSVRAHYRAQLHNAHNSRPPQCAKEKKRLVRDPMRIYQRRSARATRRNSPPDREIYTTVSFPFRATLYRSGLSLHFSLSLSPSGLFFACRAPGKLGYIAVAGQLYAKK